MKLRCDVYAALRLFHDVERQDAAGDFWTARQRLSILDKAIAEFAHVLAELQSAREGLAADVVVEEADA